MGFFIVKVTYMNDTQYHHKAFVKQTPGLWMHHLLLFIPQTGKKNICLSQALSLRNFLELCRLWWQAVKQTGMQGATNTAGLQSCPQVSFHLGSTPGGTEVLCGWVQALANWGAAGARASPCECTRMGHVQSDHT